MKMSHNFCKVLSLDHLVLTVKDIPKTVTFYTDVLGMKEIIFTTKSGGVPRTALQFGNQKINLHQVSHEFKPHAEYPTTGSGDLCFVSETPLIEWVEYLKNKNVGVEEGPVERTGAKGKMNSIYVRDPDGNLVEIAVY